MSPSQFRDRSLEAGASLLTIQETHGIATAQLPAVDDDPVDRLLIAQARVEGLTAVSADATWSGYPLSLHRV